MLNIIYISASSVLDNLSIGSFVDLPIGHLLKHLALKMHQRVCFIIALLEIFSRPFSLISGSIPSRVPHLFLCTCFDFIWANIYRHIYKLCAWQRMRAFEKREKNEICIFCWKIEKIKSWKRNTLRTVNIWMSGKWKKERRRMTNELQENASK